MILRVMTVLMSLALVPVNMFSALFSPTLVKPQQNSVSADQTPPVISVWYGSNQNFTLGTPQNFINILGNVSDPESGVSAIAYTLNGSSSRPLSFGPDNRRLVSPGDFNIDISISDSKLLSGNNKVVIQAMNNAGIPAQTTVTFVYYKNSVWSFPYSINWSTVGNIQSAAQVVDGLWQVTPNGVRTVQRGYDRILAIGDLTWRDYDVLVPVTINSIDASAYGGTISGNPGIGVNLHWTGHTNDPVSCGQPLCGWNPTGGSIWYEFTSNGQNRLKLIATPPSGTATNGIQFSVGQKYWIRAHVETNSSGQLYKAKAWADGTPEPDWMLQKQADTSNLNHGSFLLVAHYVDATFGNVTVTQSGVPLVLPDMPFHIYTPSMIRGQ